MKRRMFSLAAIVLALALVGCQAQAPATKTTAPQTTKIQRGNLTATISAAGTVTARSQVSLVFQTAGQVKEIKVEVGDKVKAGQVLAKLDTTDLETSVTKAQIALESSKLQLEKTKRGPKPAQIESAKASLASAQAAYQVALTKYGLTDAQIAVARAQLDKSASAIQRAQAAYEWEKNNWLNKDPTLSAQKKALDDAQDAYGTTLISYNQQVASINDTGIKSAASQVAQAQSSLDKLLDTPTPEDIAQAEAAVKQSEASLKQAQVALAKATVVAPFDGTVGDIFVQIGQWATASTQVIALVDLSKLDLTVTMSEVDVPKIQAGQQVELVLDAEPGVVFNGALTQIDLVGTTTQGVVNYGATVSIDNPTDVLRPGMNASASIILQHREDVLLVPNRAVRTTGRVRTATVVYEGQLIDMPVTLGLSGDAQSEVLSGLQEGDLVLINQTTTTGARGVLGAGAAMGGFGR